MSAAVSIRRPWHAAAAILPAASLIGILILCLGFYRPGFVIAQGDSINPLFDPFLVLRKSFFIWSPFYSPVGSLGSGAEWAPWFLSYGVLSKLAGSQALGQVMQLFVITGGAWFAMYRWVRAAGASRTASCVAAWAYLCNPWTALFMSRNYPLEWLMMVLPLVLWAAVESAKNPALRRPLSILVVVTAAFLVPFISANPALLVLFVASIAIGVVFALRFAVPGFAAWLGRTFLASAVVSLWWIIPFVAYYLSNKSATTTSAREWAWVIARSSFLNNLRFNGFWAWIHPSNYPFAQAYDENLASYAAGFLLIAALLLALLLLRGENLKIARFAAVVSLAALFVSKGLHPPLAFINELLYRLPLAFLFREPTVKAPLLALLFLSLTLAVLLDDLFRRVTSVAGKTAIVAVTMALIIVSFSPWLIVGSLATMADESGQGLPSSYVRVPAYWRQAMGFLNQSDAQGAVAVFPSDRFYGTYYRWPFYGADVVVNNMTWRPVWPFATVGYTEDEVGAALSRTLLNSVRRREPGAAALFRSLGIRYVVVRGDVEDQGPETEEVVRAAFRQAPVSRFGPLAILDLGPVPARLVESRAWIAVDGQRLTPVQGAELHTMAEAIPRIQREDNIQGLGRVAEVHEFFGRAGTVLSPSAKNISLVNGAPLRVLIDSSTTGSAFLPGSRRIAVLTGTLGEPFSIEHLRIPLPSNSRSPRATSSPTFIAISGRSDQGLDAKVFNPAPYGQAVDVRLAVTPQRDTTYVAADASSVVSDTVRASTIPVWAEFHKIVVPPGASQFIVNLGPASRAAARSATPVADGRRGALVLIGHAAPQNEADRAYGSRELSSVALTHIEKGYVPLGLPAAADPAIHFEHLPDDSRLQYGATWYFTVGGQTQRCYTLLPGSERLRFRDAFDSCLRFLSSPLRMTDLLDLVVDGVSLDVALRAGVDSALVPTATDVNASGYWRAFSSVPTWTPSDVGSTVPADIGAVSVGGGHVVIRRLRQTVMPEPQMEGGLARVLLHAGSALCNQSLRDRLLQRPCTVSGPILSRTSEAITLQQPNGFITIPMVEVIAVERSDRRILPVTLSFTIPAQVSGIVSVRPVAAPTRRLVLTSTAVRLRDWSTESTRPVPTTEEEAAAVEDSSSADSDLVAIPTTDFPKDRFGNRKVAVTLRVPAEATTTPLDLLVGVLPHYSTTVGTVACGANRVSLSLDSWSSLGACDSNGWASKIVWTTRADALDIAAVGEPPHAATETDLRPVLDWGWLIVAHPQAAGKEVVVSQFRFASDWIGIEVGPGFRIMPHFRADGWQNAWQSNGGKTFMLMSSLTVLQLLLMAVAVFVPAIMLAAVRRHA